MSSYEELWLRKAALLLNGEYEIFIIVCYPSADNKCQKDHRIIRCEPYQIRGYAENNLAPMVYMAPVGEVPISLEDEFADNIYWLGDIARMDDRDDVYVICGDLLAYIVDGDDEG